MGGFWIQARDCTAIMGVPTQDLIADMSRNFQMAIPQQLNMHMEDP